MSRKSSKPKPGVKPGGAHEPRTGEERARDLLLRLETNGPKLQNAAEEIDRLQGRLERDGLLASFRERVAELADAWSGGPLRGDRAHAWLVLVGAFGLEEQVEIVAALAADTGLPTAIRVHACRVLPRFAGETSVSTLQEVLLSRSDPQVRAAAADGLAELRDRSVAPVLAALLEEELPKNVWAAVSAAYDRVR
ncbi:MAG: HEAT repeat domain-containing protein [Actinomycetota bacterium]